MKTIRFRTYKDAEGKWVEDEEFLKAWEELLKELNSEDEDEQV